MTSHGDTSTSLTGGGSDTMTDWSDFGSGTLTNVSDYTLSNGINTGWSSTSLNGTDHWTSDSHITNNHSITGGWDHSTSSFDNWGSGDNVSTNYTSTGGSGFPDNTISTSLFEASGDSTSVQDENSTSLSGLSNDITSVTWTSDTGSETLTNDSDSTSPDTLAFTSFGATGTRGADWTDVQNNRTFSSSSFDHGGENYTHGYDAFYNYTDRSDATTHTTGTFPAQVVSTSADSTHVASGQDDTFAEDQGSDTFSAMGTVGSTGTSTHDSGSEQFGFGQSYGDNYNDQTISHASNDGHGHTSNSHTIGHTDQGSNGWSWNVEGSDTFGMSATDPSTGATSWDTGGENYTQDQAHTATFGNNSISNSSTVSGISSTTFNLVHTGGGTDTLSSGDQVGHLYGAVSYDPTTGDIASSTGSDNYDLGKSSSDTYTNLSTGATTTHSDSGFAGATYVDEGADTDLTTTTDPDTGDVSNDNNTDSYREDDGSTESFTDQGSVTTVTTGNHPVNSSTSHTDNGSDSVSSYDQDTDISSDTSNNGLSTSVTSDTTTTSDSSSDSYGDQSSTIETTLGSSVTVTNSSTYTDAGSDSNSSTDQGTDTSSDASSDSLASDWASDTHTNTESSSDSYSDQSFSYENVANGVVASASSSDSSTDSGNDSSWANNHATTWATLASADGLDSDSGSDTHTDTASSNDSYGNQSYDEIAKLGGDSLAASNTDSHSDCGNDSNWSYDYGSTFSSSATGGGTESDTSSNTFTNTESSGDTSSDQTSNNETEYGGSVVSGTSTTTDFFGDYDRSSDVVYGSDTNTGPYNQTVTSSTTETDTSSKTTNDQEGVITETDSDTGTNTPSDTPDDQPDGDTPGQQTPPAPSAPATYPDIAAKLQPGDLVIILGNTHIQWSGSEVIGKPSLRRFQESARDIKFYLSPDHPQTLSALRKDIDNGRLVNGGVPFKRIIIISHASSGTIPAHKPCCPESLPGRVLLDLPPR